VATTALLPRSTRKGAAMTSSNCPYGFRIVGDCRNERRLVDAANALAGYAACDQRAEVDHESYLSGDAFRQHLERTGSTKGYGGPCWSAWLWFDIDRENDLDAATVDACKLAASLVERYALDGDNLLLFFSGSKGFHVGLPTALWQPEPSGEFNRLARRFAERAAERVGIAIDTGVYDKVRAFRAPNSRHPKTGLHKRRLTFDELLHLTPEAIAKLAASPEPFDVPADFSVCQAAIEDWQEAAAQLAAEKTAHNDRKEIGAATLNRATLEFIRDGATVGDRHRLLFSAAANLGEFGCPSALAYALLSESGLDSRLSPSDVRRQIACGLNTSVAESTPQGGPGTAVVMQSDSMGQGDGKRGRGGSVAFDGRSCQQLTGLDAKGGTT